MVFTATVEQKDGRMFLVMDSYAVDTNGLKPPFGDWKRGGRYATFKRWVEVPKDSDDFVVLALQFGELESTTTIKVEPDQKRRLVIK